MIGTTISHYRILEKLGEGGMGVVYKAEDTTLGRIVALKFLPPELTRDPDAKERFINEARAASALDHPNICTIYEVGRAEDGRTFIAMACYEGETLKDRIERGPLPIDEALDITTQIAQGLDKAHGRGIVHRDIKPANIFLTKDGLVKIVDFGLAKLEGMKLTKTGSTLGTARYMSPEQARGEQVDQRTDIWSLGIVLYEMLTGKDAFHAEYEQAALYAIMNEDPEPVTALRTGVPMELERIAGKCLVKNAGERYQHADEIVADLRHLKTTRVSPSSAAPSSNGQLEIRMGTRRRPARRWLWVAAVCVIAALAIGVLIRYRGTSEVAQGPERKMLAVLPFVNLGSPENEYFAAGITEEITSRLATIKELGVISRTSAVHYAGTDKTVREIGSELGVGYILEGTVRWAPEPGGTSRVRITPQLIRVSDDTHLWSEPYDRVIQDIFEIQSDIAQNVVEHLGLTLLEAGHPAVERRPTENLEAYQAYLRGEYFAGQPHFVAKYWEDAAQNYQLAVELDPDFALAHAKLSIAHARLYYYRHDMSQERRNKARTAIDRAVEQEPDNPEIRLALGYFHLLIERDVKTAFREFDIAAQDLPDNAEILEARGNAFRQEGHWEEALDQYRKACALDPLNASRHDNLAETCWWTRRYTDALHAADKAIALAPDQMWPYLNKVFNYWSWKGKGALRESRTALVALGPGADPDWMVWAWFNQAACEGNYLEALGHLESLPGEWLRTKIGACPKSLCSAQIYELMGEPQSARDDFEKARDLLEKEIVKRPDDPRYHSSLGIAFAALGRRDDAIREGKRAVELLPMSKDAVYGIPYVIDLAQIHTILGEQDAALAELERLLSQPSWVSPAFLEMDFRWNRLRDNPKFKKLLKKYSSVDELRSAEGKSARSVATRADSVPPATAAYLIGVPSIAVLPFKDMSPRQDQEYFCEGIAEELLNALVQIEGLRVAARTSSAQFKDKAVNVRDIGRELGVRSVLEGSVRKSGDRLRITAQLINVEDGYHLFSEKYDRTADDIFAIQDEISLAIVDRLKVRLLHGDRSRLTKRHTENEEAYRLYLQGRYFWNRRHEGGMQQGLEYFQKAIEADPGYALPYSGIADCYFSLGYLDFLAPREAFGKCREAALKAMEMDPDLAEARASLGIAIFFLDWDPVRAEAEFRRAIGLNPNYATVHMYYSMLLAAAGRFDEAIVEIKRAMELDPVQPIIGAAHAHVLWVAGRESELAASTRALIEFDPNFWVGWLCFGISCSERGRFADAEDALRKANHLAGGASTLALGHLGYALGKAGKREEARSILDRLLELRRTKYASAEYIAILYRLLDEQDASLEWLGRAIEERDHWLRYAKHAPNARGMRSDPRFQETFRRLRF